MWIEIRFYLYALVDPRDGSWRYIGITKQPKVRHRHHINAEMKTAKGRWISELKSLGLKPKFVAIQDFDYPIESYRAEKEWIEKLRPSGLLLNETNGGRGGRCGMKMSEDNKDKLAQVRMGRPMSQETRHKISTASMGNTKRRGSKHSEEAKIKMKLAWQRRKNGAQA
jgi:hypothetical protein